MHGASAPRVRRERRKIPAFNEVDDEELPADLEYVR